MQHEDVDLVLLEVDLDAAVPRDGWGGGLVLAGPNGVEDIVEVEPKAELRVVVEPITGSPDRECRDARVRERHVLDLLPHPHETLDVDEYRPLRRE